LLSFSPNICSFCSLGVGGQVDFIRGAALSLDGEGVPIIACPSTAVMGDKITSRIVPSLKPGRTFSYFLSQNSGLIVWLVYGV
jgi:hypothetical protein